MKFKFIVGVDMSKNWFNYCLMTNNLEILEEGKVDNDIESIDEFLESLFQQGHLSDHNDILLIMEHTGIYVQPLVDAWMGQSGKLTIVPATKVSQLLAGLDSWDEKTDKMDARRLAEYATRYPDKLKLWEAEKPGIMLLKRLQRLRSRLIDTINMLVVPINESKRFDPEEISIIIENSQSRTLIAAKEDLKDVERQLKELVNADKELKYFYDLINSVEGAGPVIAHEIILTTAGFEKFKPTDAKAYARYCGVVPLQKQSGVKKRRARNSKKANMVMKKLLTMGALALTKSKGELGQYYRRKKEEGKPHYCVINAMRNKMILRIFAVVRNGTMYQKNLNLNLE